MEQATMIDILSNNIGFMIITMGALSIQSIFIWLHQDNFNTLRKSIKELEDNLALEDSKINQNFEKIHNDLSVAEREIQQAVNAMVQANKNPPVEPNKEFQTFLTPKGRIKKQYRHTSIAKKLYKQFHSLKASKI